MQRATLQLFRSVRTNVIAFSAAAMVLLGVAARTVSADAPVRNTNTEVVTDFLTAEDGTLDAFDDLLLDADPCDPVQPDVLEPVLAPDAHWLSFGELSQVSGRASLKCVNKGTHAVLELSGLIPNGVYTIWLLTFESPGFTPDFTHHIGEGALGAPDGSENVIVASPEGEGTLSVFHAAGPLSEFGEVSGCLFDEFEFHLVGAYHPDGLTYGPTPGPSDAPNMFCAFIEHFGYVFRSPAAVESLLAAAKNEKTCWEKSAQVQCQGLPYGSDCIDYKNNVGKCWSSENIRVAPGVYDCNACQPKGKRTKCNPRRGRCD